MNVLGSVTGAEPGYWSCDGLGNGEVVQQQEVDVSFVREDDDEWVIINGKFDWEIGATTSKSGPKYPKVDVLAMSFWEDSQTPLRVRCPPGEKMRGQHPL